MLCSGSVNQISKSRPCNKGYAEGEDHNRAMGLQPNNCRACCRAHPNNEYHSKESYQPKSVPHLRLDGYLIRWLFHYPHIRILRSLSIRAVDAGQHNIS
jgi:hypothetical protein